MASTNIPGFRYDEVKKKYFKIQPYHIAPTGSAYSTDCKREAKYFSAAKGNAAFEGQKRKQIMQRSEMLAHPLGGHLALGREIGRQCNSAERMTKFWARNLYKKRTMTPSDEHGIERFVYDEATGTFIYGLPVDNCHLVQERIMCASPIDPKTLDGQYNQSFYMTTNSIISSMALSISRSLMITSMGSHRLAGLNIAQLCDPVDTSSEVDIVESNDGGEDANPNPKPTLRVENAATVDFPYGSDITVWACSACPDESRSTFAVATSCGTCVVTGSESYYATDSAQAFERNINGQRHETEILAVDWLSNNVTLNGGRGGKILLWDKRIEGHAGLTLRIKHPSAVNHVRKVNENIIIVAGLKDQLCTYDLRYTPRVSSSRTTIPYMTFPEYRNSVHNGLSLGFDVYGDIVAAATEQHKVALFDVGTGMEIASDPVDNNTPHKYLSPLSRCVRIVGGERTVHPMMVLVANGSSVISY